MNQYTLYDGSGAAPIDPIVLRAGPMTMVFEPQSAFLRYVRVGSVEVVRGVYAAVRDHNWGTIRPAVSDLKSQVTADGGFELTFSVACREGPIDVSWQGRITGEPAGRVTYTMRGVAKSIFQTNRTGFCILHPASAGGAEAVVSHAAGGQTRGRLPVGISPGPPFLEMAGISHEFGPGAWCDVVFSGDVFEMEDQRNWTDASFKTFCRPLARPFPYAIKAGERIEQSVSISLRGSLPSSPTTRRADAPITITLDESKARPLPAIGLGMPGDGEPLTQRHVERLKALHLSHLRVDLRLDEPAYIRRFAQALDQSMAIGALLEVAAYVGDDAEGETHRLAHLLGQLQPMPRYFISRVLVLPRRAKAPTPAMIDASRRALDAMGIPIFAGSAGDFAELNRNRPPTERLDGICFSINPQVHAFDNASLAETLEAQAQAVTSARQIAGGRQVIVSPVTFRPRFNPDATGPAPAPASGELPRQVDVRQMSLFGAGWTLGSIKQLAQAGAQSMTYYETVGWRGVMEREAGSPIPARFASIRGGVYPLYHVLADIGEFAGGGSVVDSVSGDPLTVEAIMLVHGQRRRLMLANLTHRRVRASVRMASTLALAMLDESTAEQAMSDPESFRRGPARRLAPVHGSVEIEMPPYAVARLDLPAE
jgi:hypothetical protein